MNANPYLDQYKKNQLETATPEQVLILLYDGAIQFLNKAKIAIQENDNERCNDSLFSCEKIILEFMNTLDMERGGDLAKRLYSLYEYFYNTLVNVNFSKDINKLEEVLRHLVNLRATWKKAIDIANSQQAAHLMEHEEKQDSYKPSSEDDDYEYVDDDEDEDEEEI